MNWYNQILNKNLNQNHEHKCAFKNGLECIKSRENNNGMVGINGPFLLHKIHAWIFPSLI